APRGSAEALPREGEAKDDGDGGEGDAEPVLLPRGGAASEGEPEDSAREDRACIDHGAGHGRREAARPGPSQGNFGCSSHFVSGGCPVIVGGLCMIFVTRAGDCTASRFRWRRSWGSSARLCTSIRGGR